MMRGTRSEGVADLGASVRRCNRCLALEDGSMKNIYEWADLFCSIAGVLIAVSVLVAVVAIAYRIVIGP
jgi:hypothetical protein